MARLICPNCSNAYTPAGGLERCPKCGYGARPPPVIMTSAGAPSLPAMQPPAPALAPPGQTQAQATSGFAITSMTLGLVSLIPIPFVAALLAVLALIFGFVAFGQIQRRGLRGKGMAVTGVVLGAVVLLLWIFIVTFITAVF